MGIRSFFHKIKTGVVRAGESSIPYVDGVKRYGNYGESRFVDILRRELPSCKIKRNVVIFTPDGNAEIDCLVLYENKLFAIEVKRWKGKLTECRDGFLQEKIDRWTGERHDKVLKSPFKQLQRAIGLLKRQISVNAWINAIVFFEDDESESVSVFSDHVWFDDYRELAAYIREDGKRSFGMNANDFFEKCVAADCLYSVTGRSLRCVVDRSTLRFEADRETISPDRMIAVRVVHHWSYDELYVQFTDGTKRVISLENAKIRVCDDGRFFTYALCKLDYIELGRALT